MAFGDSFSLSGTLGTPPQSHVHPSSSVANKNSALPVLMYGRTLDALNMVRNGSLSILSSLSLVALEEQSANMNMCSFGLHNEFSIRFVSI